MCQRGFDQRKFLTDNGPEGTLLKTCSNRSMNFDEVGVGCCKERHTKNGGLAAHGITWIDFDCAAIPDDDDAAAPRSQHREIFSKIDVRQHLRNEVYAATAGNFHDFFFICRGAVVHNVMCALLGYHRPALLRTTCADHLHSCRATKLNTCNPDSTGRTVDEHRFVWLSVSALEQRSVCSSVRNTQSSALCKSYAFGKRVHACLIAQGEFCTDSCN